MRDAQSSRDNEKGSHITNWGKNSNNRFTRPVAAQRDVTTGSGWRMNPNDAKKLTIQSTSGGEATGSVDFRALKERARARAAEMLLGQLLSSQPCVLTSPFSTPTPTRSNSSSSKRKSMTCHFWWIQSSLQAHNFKLQNAGEL
ncbi:hypothetical protein Pint_24697 [Pistacia integerrima]|uniref:Uncharacterized protein n=1 Tax=Pistacia integerrima TaxID=434235 RepID=A0ACC0YD24_9ROSI|nr:hypothetical protein Pint_24697 [Pistacia integerrima]